MKPWAPITLTATVLFLIETVRANSGALIVSKSGQPLTSSTLFWVGVNSANAKTLADVVDTSGQGGGNICRFQHAGRWEVGSTTEADPKSGCRVVYYGKIVSKDDRYEVLINQHQAGRLVWSAWDRSHTSYVGAVQVGDHYVGRILAKNDEVADDEIADPTASLQYNIGHMDPAFQRGRLFAIDQYDQVVESIDGEILLEIEPVAYELGPLVSKRRKMQTQEDVQLAHTILDNDVDDQVDEESSSLNVASTLSYVTSHSVYIGQVKGMVQALPSTIQLGLEGGLVNRAGGATAAGGAVEFRWGDASISATFPQVLDVSHMLDKGTGVNVSLTARRVTFDGPFTARLSTTYADGSVTTRQIDGNARQTLVEDVTLHYSPVYYLADGSIVPVTTTSTTTTTTTEATTTASTTTTEAPSSTVTLPPNAKRTKENQVELEWKDQQATSSNSGSQAVCAPSILLLVTLLFVSR